MIRPLSYALLILGAVLVTWGGASSNTGRIVIGVVSVLAGIVGIVVSRGASS